MGKNEWIQANGIKRWEFYRRQRECRNYLLEKAEAGQELPVNTDALPKFFELPSNLHTVLEPETGEIITKKERNHLIPLTDFDGEMLRGMEPYDKSCRERTSHPLMLRSFESKLTPI